jgi:hypothetical protein
MVANALARIRAQRHTKYVSYSVFLKLTVISCGGTEGMQNRQHRDWDLCLLRYWVLQLMILGSSWY